MDIFAKGPGVIEKMFANMLGLTPEEMAATLTDFRNMVVETKSAMDRIEAKQDSILGYIQGKVIENDDGSERANRDGNGERGTVPSIGGPTGIERDAA